MLFFIKIFFNFSNIHQIQVVFLKFLEPLLRIRIRPDPELLSLKDLDPDQFKIQIRILPCFTQNLGTSFEGVLKSERFHHNCTYNPKKFMNLKISTHL